MQWGSWGYQSLLKVNSAHSGTPPPSRQKSHRDRNQAQKYIPNDVFATHVPHALKQKRRGDHHILQSCNMQRINMTRQEPRASQNQSAVRQNTAWTLLSYILIEANNDDMDIDGIYAPPKTTNSNWQKQY